MIPTEAEAHLTCQIFRFRRSYYDVDPPGEECLLSGDHELENVELAAGKLGGILCRLSKQL